MWLATSYARKGKTGYLSDVAFVKACARSLTRRLGTRKTAYEIENKSVIDKQKVDIVVYPKLLDSGRPEILVTEPRLD